ncbi:hypothetical protein RD792_005612 [Penstemon davidsonii]|uniref:Cathepsin propeptide inhibitor domain-containing protein n=1 Tax=Penstemon davidsonii TaxID=160366 RepID=A0ABR0DEW2_9LAMI|nr:hypothetical protein RD792_005612 [Penstemon davidsonii]
MSQYNRSDDSKEEKETRLKIYKDNLAYIESFNSGGHKYELGVYEFADLTKDEFLTKYTGNFVPQKSPAFSSFIYENVKEVQNSVDWRELGAVTPVKSQGPCG